MINISWSRLKIHVICWTIYIAYEVLVSLALLGVQYDFLSYFFFYVLNVILFYVHGEVVMPKVFRSSTNTYWLLMGFVLLEVLIYIVSVTIINYELYFFQLNKRYFTLDFLFVIAAIWRPFLFILYSSGYFFLNRYIVATKEKMRQDIELQLLNAQLARLERDFLRAQIAPHLLFNTLSFVKYAAKNNPMEADEVMQRLSEVLRFSIARTPSGLILLDKELRQIDNIIRINQLRFQDNLYINYTLYTKNEDIHVLPLVLITMIENLFKHGNLSESEHPAIVRISCSDGFLIAETINLMNEEFIKGSKSFGTGLINVQMRLKETYGDDFVFKYGQSNKMYRVYLKMPYATS